MTSLEQRRPRPGRTLLILGLAALSFSVNQTSLIPAITDLIRSFHTDAGGVAWALTGYFVSAAVFTPVLGRLGDMFGKRRLLVIALLVFAVGNVVSAAGPTLGLVVAGRVIQGAGGGVFPLCFGIIRDEFPRERVRASIGLVAAVAGIGAGVGLVLGGALVDYASYHWIFWVGAAISALAAGTAAALIPESPNRTAGSVDIRGAVILGAGLVMPLVAVSEANRWGWTSPRTLLLFTAGVALLAVWVGVERRTAEPLADVRTLARPPVLMTNLATLLTGFGMFGSFVLIPQIAEAPSSAGYGFGASATRAGLLIVPGTVVSLVMGPVSGLLGERLGSRIPLALGALIASLGLLLMGFQHGTQIQVTVFSMLIFGGVGLAFAAMPNLIIDAVAREQTGEATGFNALVRSVGASMGSQVSASILTGSIGAGRSLPTDASFQAAFALSAAIALAAALTSLVIPRVRPASAAHMSALEDLGASAPLGEPAYAID